MLRYLSCEQSFQSHPIASCSFLFFCVCYVFLYFLLPASIDPFHRLCCSFSRDQTLAIALVHSRFRARAFHIPRTSLPRHHKSSISKHPRTPDITTNYQNLNCFLEDFWSPHAVYILLSNIYLRQTSRQTLMVMLNTIEKLARAKKHE